MNTFTQAEQTVLYQIDSLRSDGRTITKEDIEAVVDIQVLRELIDNADVCFDAAGNLTYAPYPRR
jgi:hypothetical protein